MSKPVEHEIKTYEDIINCISPDNLENFLEDFREALETYLSVLGVAKVGAQMIGMDVSGKRNSEIVEPRGFVWIDDGKHKHKMKIEVELKS